MISSIFGKTQQELEKERAEAYQTMITPLKGTGQQRDIQGLGNLFSIIARKVGEKRGGDPAMQAAIEAEGKQTALNKQLASIDKPDDPLRFMVLADAAKSVGNMDAYIDYIGMAADAENIAERRRKQYRDQEMKEADELSEQLDLRDKGIALSTIYDEDVPEEERNKALQNFYQVGGTSNDLYAYQQIDENLSKGDKKITKRQEDITDKFLSAITNEFANPADVYRYFKSIHGDNFTVPESFLDQTNIEEKKTDNPTLTRDELKAIEEQTRKQKEEEENTSTGSGRKRRRDELKAIEEQKRKQKEEENTSNYTGSGRNKRK